MTKDDMLQAIADATGFKVRLIDIKDCAIFLAGMRAAADMLGCDHIKDGEERIRAAAADLEQQCR